MLNQKLYEGTQKAGAQVPFVAVENSWDSIQGHMCEPGVDESRKDGHGAAENREQAALCEYGTDKDGGEYEDIEVSAANTKTISLVFPKNWDAAAANQTHIGEIANFIQMGMADNPDAYKNLNAHIDLTFEANATILRAGLAKVFHPTVHGQSMYARLAFDAITDSQGLFMGQIVSTLTFSAPTAAAQTAHSGTKTSSAALKAPSLTPMSVNTSTLSFNSAFTFGIGSSQASKSTATPKSTATSKSTVIS